MPYIGTTNSDNRIHHSIAIGLVDTVEPAGEESNVWFSPIFGRVKIKGKGWDDREVEVELNIDRQMIPVMIAALQSEEDRLNRINEIKAGDRVKLLGEGPVTDTAEVISILDDGKCYLEWKYGFRNIIARGMLVKVMEVNANG